MPGGTVWTVLGEEGQHLDLTGLPIEVAIPDIDANPEFFGLFRKLGLGGSDSSALLDVSPFTTYVDLIEEKARNYLTEDEQEVGDLANVRKGNELEPLIIQKTAAYMGKTILKPADMYRFSGAPWMTMNFDGVMEQEWQDPQTGGFGRYVPVEIKVLTVWGEKHYDKRKASFQEPFGLVNAVPERVDLMNASIAEKAGIYGIPPYYYTQLQNENLALGRPPYSYLSILAEKDWSLYYWFVWRDDAVQGALIERARQAWVEISRLRGPDYTVPAIEPLLAKAGVTFPYFGDFAEH
jgi:hypothetical protein